MSEAGRRLVRDRYPQDFVQEPDREWVTRSTTDDQVVLSLRDETGYVAHSDAMPWGHGDGLIHLGGRNFALGRQRSVKPFSVDIKGDHLEITGSKAYRVSGSGENILLGNGFGRIVVMTKYPDRIDKRVRIADQAAFFASTKYSSIGTEMFTDGFWISEGAVQGVGFIDPNTVVVISGGANVAPRVSTYDAETGAETKHPRIDTSHIDGSHIEAQGFDQGMTMIVYTYSNGNVRFRKVPVLVAG